MPKRGNHGEFEASTGYCQCGEVLPPAHAWTDMTKAQHDWRHRLWAHTVNAVWDNRKPTVADARALIGAAQVYIGALEADNVVQRRTVWDLRDRVDELEAELAAIEEARR